MPTLSLPWVLTVPLVTVASPWRASAMMPALSMPAVLTVSVLVTWTKPSRE